MKRVSATQARRNWFRLLDEVAAGEVVVIERKGRRIVLRRDEKREDVGAEGRPDYSGLLRVPGEERADRWGWDWSTEEGVALREEPADEAPPGKESAGGEGAG